MSRTTGRPSEGDLNVSARRSAWRDGLGPNAKAGLEADERYFLRQSLSTPCLDTIVVAEGPWLVDADGRRLLDFHGNSVHQLGHGHPKVIAAIQQALGALPFSPRRYANPYATALARRLVEATPEGLDKVLFAPSGSAAISMALKIARHATGRHKTLSFWDAFHGANLDAISVGGEAIFRKGAGPLMPGVEHLPPLDLAERFFGSDRPFDRLADYIDYCLEVQGDVGALLAEPMRWTTVMRAPPDFWPRVKTSCERHGALLIFDEIPSSPARTGTLFACEQVGATPDILVLGKGLGGGVMPLAAVVARAELDCAPEAALGHYTHEKSPTACAAGLATLEVIEEEKLVERARWLGERGLARLTALKERHASILDVRECGCFFGVRVANEDLADALLYGCLRRGLSFKIGGGDVLTLCPPLTIEENAFDQAFAILDESLAEAAGVRP